MSSFSKWIIPTTLLALSAASGEIVIGHDGKGGSLEKIPLPDPVAFEDGGKKGWKINIPGARPLATPAVDDDIVFVGGGFGSHEFYAIDAKTGKLVWGYKTGDDGPTAAVVAEGIVAYNTESCTVYVHETKTGKLLWSKWLGDPLMSQPAIGGGRIYMAYPGGDGSHHLACMELKTGKPIWDEKIAGEIITAPVLCNGNVYCACLEGTVFKFDAASGKKHWSEQRHATSAPYIDGDKVFVSEARDGAESAAALKAAGVGGAQLAGLKAESLNAFSVDDATKSVIKDAAALPAPFLQDAQSLSQTVAANTAELKKSKKELETAKAEPETTGKTAKIQALEKVVSSGENLAKSLAETNEAAKQEFHAEKQQDAAVAFAAAPSSAKIEQAMQNLGKSSVQGVWPYQGSRPLVRGDNSYVVQGDRYRCVSNVTGKVVWEQMLDSKAKSTRPATPPSEAGGSHYLGTVDGDLVCRSMKDGKESWKVRVGGAIVFQPAVMNGRVFVGTQDGTLICVETGDVSATGWAMWGANASHDGRPAARN